MVQHLAHGGTELGTEAQQASDETLGLTADELDDAFSLERALAHNDELFFVLEGVEPDRVRLV